MNRLSAIESLWLKRSQPVYIKTAGESARMYSRSLQSSDFYALPRGLQEQNSFLEPRDTLHVLIGYNDSEIISFH